MSNKFKILKKVMSLTIVALFGVLIFCQGSTIDIQAAEKNKNENNISLIKPTKFKNFKDYVSYLKQLDLGRNNSNINDAISKDDSVSWENSSPEMPSNNDHGTTNTQVAGVDEADIIKNDGKFIYILNKNNNKIKIINALQAANMKLAGEISLQASDDKNYRNYSDMYLKDNKLVVIYTLNVNQGRIGIMPIEAYDTKIAPDYISGKSFIGAEIYDISDKSSPKLERTVMNEGNLAGSRMIGDTLYLISNKYLNLYMPMDTDPYTKENLLISYSDSKISSEIKYAPVEDMYCVLDRNNPYNMQNISIVSALNVNKNDEMKITSFTGTGYNIYMSLSNIYIFGQSWDNNTTYTDIYKYNVNGTDVKFTAVNKAPGSLLNQFSADEYKGHLRIATTEWNNGNNIFIFDENLQKTGEILGLAKGEQIKSCRFMQDKGYVVTYKNIDPLFALDLSNPKNPRVTGELKIPGFSSYLHPISENLIVGIGENTTPLYWRDENGKEIEAGVKQIGIKASLFDVSNENKPVEIKSISIGGPGSYTDIGYDHKSFVFIKDKDLIAIRGTFSPKPANGVESHEYKSQAILMSVKNNSIEIEKIFDGNLSYETGNRVTYIGDVLYHFTGNEIVAYRLNDYLKLGSIQYN